MFRAFAFLNVKGFSVRVTSEEYATEKTANDVLVAMREHGATGGDLEQDVPGVGWVLVSEHEKVLANWRRMSSEMHELRNRAMRRLVNG